MARETKVGLLAGLAFIICFAMILANRGQTRRYAAETEIDSALRQGFSPSFADRATDSGRAATRNPQRTSYANRPARPIRRQAPPLSTPSRIDSSGPAVTGAEIDWAAAKDEPASYRTVDTGAAETGLGASEKEIRRYAPSDTTLAAYRGNPERATDDLEALLRRRAGTSGTPKVEAPTVSPSGSTTPPQDQVDRAVRSGRSGAPSAANRPQRGSTTLRPYRVVPGDTLTGIARKVYGSAGRRVLDAILDANRSVLSDPDRITVGMTLMLPVPNPSKIKLETNRRSGGAEKETNDGPKKTSAIRWYQVRKNDRYVSIAREQLGDASRWHEIYELNKDKFPDPDRIREGVRIKLPPE